MSAESERSLVDVVRGGIRILLLLGLWRDVIAHGSLQTNDPNNYQEVTEGLERRNAR